MAGIDECACCVDSPKARDICDFCVDASDADVCSQLPPPPAPPTSVRSAFFYLDSDLLHYCEIESEIDAVVGPRMRHRRRRDRAQTQPDPHCAGGIPPNILTSAHAIRVVAIIWAVVAACIASL